MADMHNIQDIARAARAAFHANDADTGNTLLAQLMSLQNRVTAVDSANGHRGNFRFYVEHDTPTDLNALSFCGIQLAYIASERADLLTAENRTELFEITLPECLIGYDNHFRVKSGIRPGNLEPSPRWWQCNIWCLNIAGRLMAASVLKRQDHIDIARDHITQLKRYITLYGIGEYNSPTYLSHQITPLHWAWHYAPDAAVRENIAWLLDAWYLDIAEHYHAPSKTLGGTWSRHYPWDIIEHNKFLSVTAPAFERSEPSELTALDLEDYVCPDWIRDIALTDATYSVFRRNPIDTRRMMHHTPAFTFATQTGDFVWKQQDTPVMLTRTAAAGKRRIACIRTPYWIDDPGAATDYAWDFKRHAHQHDHMAILSYQHTGGGNELLFNLGPVTELGDTALADAHGTPITAPTCPILPAVPDRDPSRPPNVHIHTRAADLTYIEPTDRDIPGLSVEGPILADLGSCLVAVIPDASLTLRAAVMRDEFQIVIPVRDTALFAMIVLAKTDCPDMAAFAQRIAAVRFEQIALPGVPNAAVLAMDDITLSAGCDITTGCLYDRRVNDVPPVSDAYVCYSPFHTRRSGDTDLSPECRP